MQYVIIARDKPDAQALRAATRAAHLEYMEGWGSHLMMAGPMLTPDGAGMIGSILIMDVPDQGTLDRFLTNDPYALAGLFGSVEVLPFRKVKP